MKKIIMANWKMNLTNAQAIQFVNKLKYKNANVVICAPYTFLPTLSVIKTDSKFGGQNVSSVKEGAFTGEISAKMLKEVGVKYCLVGHSERRIYFKEDNFHINLKIKRLLEKNITPVLCFGETLEEKKKKLTKKVITKQLTECLKGVPIKKVILAYEPIWAISTFQRSKIKLSASIEDVIEVHSFIKKLVLKKYNSNTPLLYGGSVNPKNSVELLNLKDVDGVLVGSASLKVSSFLKIINNSK